MENILLAVLPLAGVALGAVLQYYLGYLKGEQERTDQRRNAAYSDYLRSVSTIANTQMWEDRQTDFRLRSEFTDAKSRISIYGSDEVITQLATFETTGSVLSTEEGQNSFLTLVRIMRNDAGNGASKSTNDELKLILFGRG